jgi:hypothetical protein
MKVLNEFEAKFNNAINESVAKEIEDRTLLDPTLATSIKQLRQSMIDTFEVKKLDSQTQFNAVNLKQLVSITLTGPPSDADPATAAIPREQIRVKARIPELHSLLPIPSSSDDYRRMNVYPTYVAVQPPGMGAIGDDTIPPGAHVEVTYGNMKNFENPILVRINPVPTAAGRSATSRSKSSNKKRTTRRLKRDFPSDSKPACSTIKAPKVKKNPNEGNKAYRIRKKKEQAEYVAGIRKEGGCFKANEKSMKLGGPLKVVSPGCGTITGSPLKLGGDGKAGSNRCNRNGQAGRKARIIDLKHDPKVRITPQGKELTPEQRGVRNQHGAFSKVDPKHKGKHRSGGLPQRQDIMPDLENLIKEVHRLGGWITSGGGYMPTGNFNGNFVQIGIFSMHKLGRAFDLSPSSAFSRADKSKNTPATGRPTGGPKSDPRRSLFKTKPWLQPFLACPVDENGKMLGEQSAGDLLSGKGSAWKGRWEIFCRVIDQSGAGAQVPEITIYPLWFDYAKKNMMKLPNGATVEVKVKAFSFTKIAADNQYFPIRAYKSYRAGKGIFKYSEWWHFQNHRNLIVNKSTWGEEMLKLHTKDNIIAAIGQKGWDFYKDVVWSGSSWRR